MALRRIRLESDEILRKNTREVNEINDSVIELLNDMAETMYAANGLGLAAPQVGVLKKIFIVDVAGEDEKRNLIEFINPEILETKGIQDGIEGCLSLPELYGEVKRPKYVKIKAYDRNGKEFIVEAEDLFARAIMHENDHLSGVLFKDLASRFLEKDELENND